MGVPISNVTRRVVYAASGTGPYNFTFEILAASDIAVYRDDTLLTLTTDYTVTINANGTGFITLVASPTGATQIAIVGNRTISRSTDFTTGGDFFANTLNDELDQQTIFAQQNAEGLQRALQAPQTDPTTIDMTLPRASVRASKVLSFDANGNPSATEFIGSNRGNWASGTLYYVRDIIKDTSTSNIWQCVVQHTSSGSQPIATNTDAAKWFLLVDAASAGASATAAANSATAAATSATNASNSASAASTSATNAASSASAASTSATNAASSASAASGSASTASTAATNAGNSATAAATSATNASNSASAASTSATNAANSASAASTSASNASTSATNAANSATSASTSASTATTQATNAASSATAAAASAAAAAASFDAFDDIYLGAKSSDPSVDNDGNALTTGDQYFNTSANELRVWNGSTWQAASTVGGTVTSLNVTGNTTLGDATADSVTVNAGTLNFAQTAQRITGDFTNSTIASRVLFQTSTSNSGTFVGAIGNGTVADYTGSGYVVWANSDTTNSNTASLVAFKNLEARISSGAVGAASFAPMTFYTGGSERMRLDTSGNLGIGTSSPSTKLHVSGQSRFADSSNASNYITIGAGANAPYGNASISTTTAGLAIVAEGAGNITFRNNGSEAMRIDTANNLGLGVTPSAWGGSSKILQILNAAFRGAGNSAYVGANYYFDGSNNRYIASAAASLYEQDAGRHIFYTAPSGTAGNAISFTQAMTLDASGNLLVAQTSANSSTSAKIQMQGSGSLTSTTVTKANMSGIGLSESSNTGNFGNGVWFNHGGLIAGIASARVTTGNWGTDLRFYTHPDATSGLDETYERARIDSSGYFKASNTGTYTYTATTNEFRQSASSEVLVLTNSNASPNGQQIYHVTDANNTSNLFLLCYAGTTTRATIRSNGGIANFQANNVNLSDRREKTNFAPAGEYLSKICAIPVQTFNYIDQNMEDDPGLTLGVVAQDVQAVAPELVMESNWGTKDEPKMRLSIYQTDLQYALMKCIQEQQAIIEQLKADVAALKGN